MKRRNFLVTTAAFAALGREAPANTCGFEICRTDAQWRGMLSAAEYKVMRREGTERPYSSPLNDETRDGTYYCRGCDQALYDAATKYDSGTGWPSFWEPLPRAIGTKPDRKLLRLRTEVHCRRCGSHLGHVFNDGPPPTGKRHCLNGVSLRFKVA